MTRTDEIQGLLSDLVELPAPSLRMLQLISDPLSTTDDLISALREDLELTAKLLRLANSSIYDLPTQIVDVSQIVAYLGLRTLIRQVVALSTQPYFAAFTAAGSQSTEAWRHGITCGIAAQILAEMKTVSNPGCAFVAGMVHDIGKLPMEPYVQCISDELLLRSEELRRGYPEAEKRLLGLDHAIAGSRIAERWRLPHSLRQAIHHHHHPELLADAGELTLLVHVADALSSQLGIGVGPEGLNYSVSIEAVQKLHLDEREIDGVRVMVLAELARSQDLLKLLERPGR